jgi:lysophospholipase L1-like esterase
VIVPPTPRYLFSRCCNDSGHCTNAQDKDYCERLLTSFLQQRNDLIKNLVAAGVTNFKVLDACCMTAGATTANTKTRITDLKGVTARDGVHFVAEGYQNLAARSQVCIRALLTAPSRPVRPSASFWRGFKSPVGSKRAPSVPVLSNRGRGGKVLQA